MKTLKLSTEIYSSVNIEKAKSAYKGFATILVQKVHGYHRLTFLHCKHDEVLTVKEFENYLIALENS